MTHRGTWIFPLTVLVAVLVSGGCASSGPKKAPPPTGKPLLRIGITPSNPPLIFKKGAEIDGIEAALARRLARNLDFDAEFVELAWEQQIPALLDGRTDIIMSGLSVTEERKLQIAYSKPYCRAGLMALAKSSKEEQFSSQDLIKSTTATIGVVRGSTGEIWVRQNCPDATIVALSSADGALFEFERSGIDLFVHDGHTVAWLAGQNEGNLVGIYHLLTVEDLAWAFRPHNTELRRKADDMLERWKKAGLLDRLLESWLPYYGPEFSVTDGSSR